MVIVLATTSFIILYVHANATLTNIDFVLWMVHICCLSSACTSTKSLNINGYLDLNVKRRIIRSYSHIPSIDSVEALTAKQLKYPHIPSVRLSMIHFLQLR